MAISAPTPVFPIVESYAVGMRLMMDHVRLFAMLSVVPLIAFFATMIVLRLVDGLTLFWLPLVQLPANFVLGLEVALILRFFLLQEFPLIVDDESRRARNREVLASALVYTIVSYLFNGFMAGMTYLAKRFETHPIDMAPYAPLAMAGLVIMFWSLRWFWLWVPLALGWDVKGLYARLSGWQGSLRIGGLFVLCSLTVNVVTYLLRYMIYIVGGTAGSALDGVWAMLNDAVIAAASVALGVMFACASAHALKFMTKAKQA